MNKSNTLKFIPVWLISRRRYFSLITLDAIIIFIIFIKNFGISNINLLELFLFEIFWILISYSMGCYYVKKINSIEILKSQIKKITLFAVFIFIIYLIYKFLKFQNFNNINYIPFQIITVSFLGQIILNKIIVKNYEKDIFWLFLGSKTSFMRLEKELKNSRLKANVVFYNSNLDLTINKNFEGLITDDFYNLPSDLKENLKEEAFSSIKILSKYDWSLLILQRIPNLVINRDYFLKEIRKVEMQKLELGIKRLGDIFFSGILILITLPIVTLSMILIKLEDNGPIFYSQIRTGLKCKKIKIWKLRTMYVNSEDGEAKWAIKNDKRITKFGKILRKTRIDELPQLFSIIKGDMSLIGPRPERPEFDAILEKEISNYSLRYTLKPGLSGWAQVNYTYGSSINDAEKKLSYELFYLTQFSIWIDLLIFFKTINLVLNGKGSEPEKVI